MKRKDKIAIGSIKIYSNLITLKSYVSHYPQVSAKACCIRELRSLTRAAKLLKQYDNLSEVNCGGGGETRQFSLSFFESVIR